MKARHDDPLLLGLDCGTSSLKAGIYAVDGLCVGFGSEPVPALRDGPNRATHDPEAVWRAAALAIRRALTSVDDVRRVVGAACASVGEAALLVDRTNAPLTPILAWVDRRGADTCKAWIDAIGPDALFALTGQPPEPILTAYKLDWLRRNASEAYASAASWVTLGDYIAFRLSGTLAAERSLACRSGVFSIADADWARDFIADRGLAPRLFPLLSESGSVLGAVQPDAADATGLPQTCIVGVGGYDQALGALICGGYHDGVLSVSMGSTEAQILPTAEPSRSARLCKAAICQGMLGVGGNIKLFLLSGIYTAGSAIEWLRETIFDGACHAKLIAAAEEVPPGCHGAGFLPQLLMGVEQGAQLRPNGAFWGLGLGTDRASLYRAVLEGLAYEGRMCTEAMAAAPEVQGIRCIRAAGGDTQNMLRLRIKAAVAGLPVEVLQTYNASSLGAAVMGGLAASTYRSIEDALAGLNIPVIHVAPKSELVAFYDRAYAETYRKAAPLLAALTQPEA